MVTSKSVFINLFNLLGLGSSDDPCSLEYRGRRPEDEPVVKQYVWQMKRVKRRLFAYFSLHSFFQLLLTPKFYTFEQSPKVQEIVSNIEDNNLCDLP